MVTGCYVHVSSDMWTVHTYRYTFEFMFKIHSRVLHQTTGSIIWVLDVGGVGFMGKGVYMDWCVWYAPSPNIQHPNNTACVTNNITDQQNCKSPNLKLDTEDLYYEVRWLFTLLL